MSSSRLRSRSSFSTSSDSHSNNFDSGSEMYDDHNAKNNDFFDNIDDHEKIKIIPSNTLSSTTSRFNSTTDIRSGTPDLTPNRSKKVESNLLDETREVDDNKISTKTKTKSRQKTNDIGMPRLKSESKDSITNSSSKKGKDYTSTSNKDIGNKSRTQYKATNGTSRETDVNITIRSPFRDSNDILSLLNGQQAGNSSRKRKATTLESPILLKPARKSSRLLEKNTDNLTLQNSPILKESESMIMNTRFIQNGSIKAFEEPQLAEPKPIYTGLPMESFPSSKIKKESLWPATSVKNKKSGKSVNSSIFRNSFTNEVDDSIVKSIDNNEFAYINNLQTQKSDTITTPSEIRAPISNPTKLNGKNNSRSDTKNGSGLKLILKTPKLVSDNPIDLTPPKSSRQNVSKKIKIISPKKQSNANLAPLKAYNEDHHVDSNDPTKDNEDFCSTCGGSGVFICCETCPKSFHFTCCDPPIQDCPDDIWICRECTAKQNPKLLKSWNDVGLFGQLLNKHEVRNPSEFQLPKKLRENTFIGVTTDQDGSYYDGQDKPELSYSKQNKFQLAGFNKDDDLEIETLYDEGGNPHLCHKCGLSGLRKRSLTSCDYCPLSWHLDCLSDLMYTPKTLGTKWKCPNHIENLLPHSLFSKRNFKNASVLDISLNNHFLEIASMNNILIKYNDQKYLNDSISPPLIEYLQHQQEDFIKKVDVTDEAVSCNENGDSHESYKTPAFFQNHATPDDKIMAKASPNLSKTLSLTTRSFANQVEGLSNSTAYIYRIPEQLIILNFLTKVNGKDIQQVSVKKKDILKEIENYEERTATELKRDEYILDSLSEIKAKPVINDGIAMQSPSLDFDELVKCALSESVEPSLRSSQPHKNLAPEELDDLLHVKKLIEAKGRESLMSFLQSG